MKKLATIYLLLVALVCNSCISDFEEGANFSFRSVEGRIHGGWKLDQVIINGIDSTEIPPYQQYHGKNIIVFTFTNTDHDHYRIEASFPNNPYPSSIGQWAYRGGNTLDTYFSRNGGAYDYSPQILNAIGLVDIKCCRYDKLVLEGSIKGINHRTVLVR